MILSKLHTTSNFFENSNIIKTTEYINELGLIPKPAPPIFSIKRASKYCATTDIIKSSNNTIILQFLFAPDKTVPITKNNIHKGKLPA